MLARRDGRQAIDLETHGCRLRPQEIDSKIHSAEEWCAWARGPKGERIEGRGSGPQDALLELTVKRKELKV